MILYCISKDGKIIERIYIISKDELTNDAGIGIIKNPSKIIHQYEQYRVVDIKNVNEIWQKILNEEKRY